MAGEWEEIRLGDLSEVITKGTTPTSLGYRFTDTGINFVKSESVTFDGWIDRSKFARIDAETHTALKRSQLKEGDVLFSMAGVYIGKTAVVPKDILPANTNQAVGIVRLDQSRANPRFIDYFLRNPSYNLFLNNLVSQSAQPNLNLNEIRNLPITLPPLAEQKAIAAVLGALDDKIELNRRMNATLEAMARALFQSWFVDFDPVRAKLDGRPPAALDSATAALFPDSFQDSPLGLIPNGWSVTRLDELIDIQGGTQPPASEFLSAPAEGYLRLVQIRDYESDAHMTFVRETPKLRKCRRDDVMIARYGASVARICWGLEGAYNVALVKASPIKLCYREFIRSYLQTYEFQARLIGMSNRSVQAGFNKGDIASFQIASPTEELFEKYQVTSWGLRRRILHNKEQSRTLATLRDTLLPKLLSGELRVPDAEKIVGVAT